jgi:hypothetical protein
MSRTANNMRYVDGCVPAAELVPGDVMVSLARCYTAVMDGAC